MSFYKTCPHCGDNLDPGEKCDCQEQAKETDPVEYCTQCGEPLSEDDALYTVDGGICEDCLEDQYTRLV